MIIKDSIKTDSPVGKSDHCMINFEFCCYIEDDSEKSESDKMSTLKAVKDLWIYNTTPLSPDLSGRYFS
jgi:hypothetical protein